MSSKRNNAKPLINRLRMWGWPFIFSRLGPDTLLICDPDIVAEINTISGGLKCRTVSPDQNIEPLQKDTRTVIVFTSTNELSLVRRLRKQYPEKTVFSASHDLAANAATTKLGLPDFELIPNKERPTETVKPILLLATPGADSPYLAKLLFDNEITEPIEFAGGPLVDLIEWLDQYSTASFTRSLRAIHGDRTNFSMLLRTDVLLALMDQAGLTKTSLLRYLRATGFRVIGLFREDHLTQCAQTQLLSGRKIRSVWDIPAGQRERFAEKAVLPTANAINCIQNIARGEQLIEMIANSDIKSTTFSLETLVADQRSALQKICKILDHETIENPTIEPYKPPIKEVPIVATLSARLKRELIDRLGLHAS